jgi:hypothetical protein
MFSAVIGAGAAAVKAMRGKKEDPWAASAGTTSWAPTPSSSSSDALADDPAGAAADAALAEAAASEATDAGSSDSGEDAGAAEGAEGTEGDGDQPSKAASSRARKAKPDDES